MINFIINLIIINFINSIIINFIKFIEFTIKFKFINDPIVKN